jgi:precorrin-8X/cobalt-precorrin-8 methylmutase
VADPDVSAQARALCITRSILATRKGVAAGCGIYLIGNAPTALFELLNLAKAGVARPALVVGVPVGFVGAEESKEALFASGLPFITCRGRKGGSAIAAAVLNALMILAEEQRCAQSYFTRSPMRNLEYAMLSLCSGPRCRF